MYRATLSLLLAVAVGACAGGRFALRSSASAEVARNGDAPAARPLPPGAVIPTTPEEGKDMLERELDAMSQVEAQLDSLRRERGTMEGALQNLELGRASGAPPAASYSRAPRDRIVSNQGTPSHPTAGAARALDATTVYFAANSSVLSEMMKRLLWEKAEILRAHPAFVLAITGHADDRGSDEDNQALSERRAEAVRAFLVSRGVEDHRLSIAGIGRTAPAAPGQSEQARGRNRRVEFEVRW